MPAQAPLTAAPVPPDGPGRQPPGEPPLAPAPCRGPAPALSADDASFAYGAEEVLRRVRLAVAPHCFTALVGPNGSGKSTLLGLLGRLLRPSGGAVRLDGAAIGRLPTKELARRLGILPQNPQPAERMTVFDLVSRGRYPHQGLFGSWTEADFQAVETAMALTGTAQLAERPVDALSGGQRQRCWIAMALAQETSVILLDEPTAFLDLRYQLEILRLLRMLTDEADRTVVAAVHDLNLAAAHADRMIFMKDGQIAAEGPVDEVCTPALIRSVFGIAVHRIAHPDTGRPVFLPAADLGTP